MKDYPLKYTPEEGEVEIALKKEGRMIRLSVSNTIAHPMERETLGRLFDRFYRGDSARTQKSGGYGIGLSAARAIAESQKGSIKASYEENQIIFTVELKNTK